MLFFFLSFKKRLDLFADVRSVHGVDQKQFVNLLGKTDREKHLVFAVPAVEESSDDVALVQGIIDHVYETSDGWVVVDYKTDRYSEKDAKTKEERAELAKSKHAFQLDSYAAAYEAAGRKVSKKYLYLV